MRRSKGRFALAFLVAAPCACATPGPAPGAPPTGAFVALQRADFVHAWDRYTVETRSLGGRPVEVFSPAPGARELVLTREEHDARVASGALPKSLGLLGSGAVPQLLEARSPVVLGREQLLRFEIEDEPLDGILLAGDAVRAFWTTPHRKVVSTGGRTEEHRTATLYLQGVASGAATLRLVPKTGEPRDLAIEVR